MSAQSVAMEEMRMVDLENRVFNVITGLDWLIQHAKRGDLSWSDLQEIKDNVAILEAKCNG